MAVFEGTYPDVGPGRRNCERLDPAEDILFGQPRPICPRVAKARPDFPAADTGPRIRNVPKARGLGSVLGVNNRLHAIG